VELESTPPARAPLRDTETGSRSNFTPGALITAAGGAVAFATAWLEREAGAQAWKAQEEAARQMTLF
jgi:hypothetical protein